MNNTIASYAREQIKEGIVKLPEGYQRKFKHIYSEDNRELPMETIIDNIPSEHLDHAVTLIENSLKRFKEKENDK